MEDNKPVKRVPPFVRAIIEVGFIIFLFYSNLLMGEFNRSGQGNTHGLIWALQDIITPINFTIAFTLGLLGHLIFEYLRKRS